MYFFIWSFQNHIPLKHSSQTIDLPRQRFGTVYHHIKLHISQTTHLTSGMEKKLWDHIKLHISQTRRRAGNPAVRFTTICLSNMPLNFLSSFEACLPYKITYFSNYLASRRNLPTRLSAIKNYTLLKRYFYEKLPFRGLTTIKNYTPLKPGVALSL